MSWGEGAQALDRRRDDFESVVDVFDGGGLEQAEAEAGAGALLSDAHGEEDVGRLGCAGVAGGAAGDGESLEVEGDDERLAVEAVEPEIGGVGGTRGADVVSAGSVDSDLRDSCEEAGFEAVAESGQPGEGAVGERAHGQLGGLAEGYDGGDVFGTGAAAALVSATDEEGLERGSATDVERADALGRVHLVAADGEQLAADAGDIDGELSGGLNGVNVEADAVLGSDLADGLDGLDDAGFVVGEHDADEACVGPDGGADGLGIDEAGGERRDAGDLDAASGEALGRGEDGGVLDGGGDEVVAGSEQAKERGVVALGAAGVEDDFCGVAGEEFGEALAGLIDGAAGGLSGLMDGGGIAEVVDPVGVHGLDHLGQEGCGGVGIHVDSAHGGDSCIDCTEIWAGGITRRWRRRIEMLTCAEADRAIVGDDPWPLWRRRQGFERPLLHRDRGLFSRVARGSNPG